MNSFSNVTLVGRLTRDAEMRTATSGTTVVRFTVAIDRRRRDGEGFVTDTTFIDVSYFGQSAKNICMYLEKGLLVAVTGELNQRKWESSDGTKNSRIEVYASNVHLIESRSMREGRGAGSAERFGADFGRADEHKDQDMPSSQPVRQFVPGDDIGPDSFDDDDVPF